MTKIIYITVFFGTFLHIATSAIAQEDTVRELKIGDTLATGVKLTVFERRETKKTTLGKYHGKWLILDFWETYCMACIDAMPRNQKLQEMFSDKVNILLVTKTNAKTVAAFLEKSKFVRGINLPFIVEDTTLNKHFFHRIIPHVVWINPDGVVKAITSGEEVNERNLSTILRRDTTLTLKSERKDWNRGVLDDLADTGIIYRSVIKKYDPSEIASGNIKRGNLADGTQDMIKGIYFSNFKPLKMYYALYTFWKYQMAGNINPNRIILQFKDSTHLKRHADPHTEIPFEPKFPLYEWSNLEEYKRDNYYSYELRLPEYVPDSIGFQYAIDNLNRIFPIKGRVEKRQIDTYVMVCKNSKQETEILLRPKNTLLKPKLKISSTSIKIDNQEMGLLMRILCQFRSLPILNETGIDMPVSMDLDFSASPYLNTRQGMVINMLTFDENTFKSQLNRYGLTIKKEKRWVDLLVITDETI